MYFFGRINKEKSLSLTTMFQNHEFDVYITDNLNNFYSISTESIVRLDITNLPKKQ